jgi:hypothetical protein
MRHTYYFGLDDDDDDDDDDGWSPSRYIILQSISHYYRGGSCESPKRTETKKLSLDFKTSFVAAYEASKS